MKTDKQLWGVSPEGKEIFLYTIKNGSGAFVRLCSVGAAIVSVAVPDKEGKLADVVLGYPQFLTRKASWLTWFWDILRRMIISPTAPAPESARADMPTGSQRENSRLTVSNIPFL